MNNTTITDTDGTVLTLDDAVVTAMASLHRVELTRWHFPIWAMRSEDVEGEEIVWMALDKSTLIALATDVCKALVWEVHPQAYHLGSPSGHHHICDTERSALALDHPTELQAWYAAWTKPLPPTQGATDGPATPR